jgi:hypothetical protein
MSRSTHCGWPGVETRSPAPSIRLGYPRGSRPWKKEWSSASGKPAQKRYPPELKEGAARMIVDLQRKDPRHHGWSVGCAASPSTGHGRPVSPPLGVVSDLSIAGDQYGTSGIRCRMPGVAQALPGRPASPCRWRRRSWSRVSPRPSGHSTAAPREAETLRVSRRRDTVERCLENGLRAPRTAERGPMSGGGGALLGREAGSPWGERGERGKARRERGGGMRAQRSRAAVLGGRQRSARSGPSFGAAGNSSQRPTPPSQRAVRGGRP